MKSAKEFLGMLATVTCTYLTCVSIIQLTSVIPIDLHFVIVSFEFIDCIYPHSGLYGVCQVHGV